MLKYSVGLDVSKSKINACLSAIDLTQKVKVKSSTVISNSMKGFGKLNTWIQKHYKNQDLPLVICMEATGNYYEHCALYLFNKQYDVSVMIPNKAKKYMQALGLKSKNDTIDAKGLSQMGAEQALPLWQPMGEYYYVLRTLTRQHQRLQELKTVESNQLHALQQGMYRSKQVEKQMLKAIALIEKQKDEVKEMIHQHLEKEDAVYQKTEKICSLKGVSFMTVAVIIAETNGFCLFENAKQLISYSGYDVVENQSGKRHGKTKISKKGNSRIRRALFMPAFNVVKYKVPPFVQLYERTIEKHNIKMKSYVAVQKKLLTTIYALWKKNESFIENYYQLSNGEELVKSSLVGFEKSLKSSPAKSETTQGNHPREVSLSDSSLVSQM
jgi:transposase